jgi:hypothetical protein
MILIRGLRPSSQAGKATEIAIDFSDRGGIVTMSRFTWPEATCLSVVR